VIGTTIAGTLVAGVFYYLGSDSAQHATTTPPTATILPFTYDKRILVTSWTQTNIRKARPAWHRVADVA